MLRLHRGIQFQLLLYTCTFLCQTPLCQSVPLLPSLTLQQNVVEHWWEGSNPTAIQSTSTSGVMMSWINIIR